MMRMLIVDDSHTMRAILGAYARDLSFDTREASDGRQGLSLFLESGPFDAVLVDWDMPRMNGLDLLREIRRASGNRATKVLMVTAMNTFSDVSRALSEGADDYLMKPIDERMFAEKLCLLGLAP